ncbi:MAG: hypothetical protein HYX89_01530 [Chloroflexi bacterium]|nr:hypothetical protein [Chloroflexota bacterium]
MTRGSWLTFVTRPITLGILLFTLVGVIAMYVTTKRREAKLQAETAAALGAAEGQEEK